MQTSGSDTPRTDAAIALYNQRVPHEVLRNFERELNDAHRAQRHAENELSKFMAQSAMQVSELERQLRKAQKTLSNMVAAEAGNALDLALAKSKIAMFEGNFPTLLDNQEAAKLLGVKPQTLGVWRSTKRYQVPYIKVGGKVRYDRRELLKWLSGRIKVPAEMSQPPIIPACGAELATGAG